VPPELPELIVADQDAWRDWLADNHTDPTGVRLVLAKKGTSGPTTLTYAQALDEALCHGWIDGQVQGGDATTYRQRFTPRRARSRWSKRNTEHIARLEAAGRMRPAGRAEVERARSDGRWAAAYAGPATIEVPDDLATALADSARATAMFGILTSQNRFAILYRIQDCKRTDTRARRIAEFVEMLELGETVHPQKRTLDG